MTLVEGEELQRLWSLVSELSSQLSANRELCQSLQAQADELKGQALHTGTGYTLRRFNLDVSKEKFDSELEKLNSQLVLENQSLSHENKQINLLLREYEGALESVMSKFRSFSHSTQQHTLQLTSHYETLLANDVHRSESASLHTSTSYSNTLAHLGGLVRLALREIDGEGADEEDVEEGSKDSDPFEAEGYRVGSPSGGSIMPTEAKQQKKKISSKTGYGSAPSRDPRWYGTGGYTGLQGDPEAEKAERALEAMTEEERLRKENETLRELLRISADVTPEVAREFGIDIPAPSSTATDWTKGGMPGAQKLSLGKPRGSRKSMGEIVPPVQDKDSNEGSIEKQGAEKEQQIESDSTNQPQGEGLTASSPDDHVTVAAEVLQAQSEPSGIAPGTISHIVEGAGGPPQLATQTSAPTQVPNSTNSPFSQDHHTPFTALVDAKAPIEASISAPIIADEVDEAIPIATSSQGESARDALLDQVEQSIAEAAAPIDANPKYVL